MNIAGVEANTLLLAQSSTGQRLGAQDPAAVQQRDQTIAVQEIAQRRQAQAPQSQVAVTAVETDDAGRAAITRQALPKDAQAEARAFLTTAPQTGLSSPSRGAVVDIYA
jgi:uncharacterized iron-regulated membrane protein